MGARTGTARGARRDARGRRSSLGTTWGSRAQLPGFPRLRLRGLQPCPHPPCATPRSGGGGGRLLGVGERLGGKNQSPHGHVGALCRHKSEVLPVSSQLSNCEQRAPGVSEDCPRRNSVLRPASSATSDTAATSEMLFRAVLLCTALALSHAGEWPRALRRPHDLQRRPLFLVQGPLSGKEPGPLGSGGTARMACFCHWLSSYAEQRATLICKSLIAIIVCRLSV